MPKSNSQRQFEPLLLLCDLDGVANILHPSPILGCVQAELDGYALQGNPTVLAGLDLVIRQYNLMPVWASCWGPRAPEAGRLLGVGADWFPLSFDYPDQDGPAGAYLSDGVDGVAEYKFPFIQAFVGDEPVAWVDDDLTPRLERWGAERDLTVPTLLIRPNPRIGITMLHLEQMLHFIERVRAWREERSPESTSPTAASFNRRTHSTRQMWDAPGREGRGHPVDCGVILGRDRSWRGPWRLPLEPRPWSPRERRPRQVPAVPGHPRARP